jgi:hypothetical protein
VLNQIKKMCYKKKIEKSIKHFFFALLKVS